MEQKDKIQMKGLVNIKHFRNGKLIVAPSFFLI